MSLAIADGDEEDALVADMPSLKGLAKLDTCVTVVDSSAFFNVLDSTEYAIPENADMETDESANDGDNGKRKPSSQGGNSKKSKDDGTAADDGEESSESVEIVEVEPPLIVDLMMNQVEFADVIVLNKTDLCTPATIEKVKKAISAINPGAHVVQSLQSQVDPALILNTGRFDATKTANSAGWLRALRETRTTEAFGVGSFVYTARRPFHPRRFATLLENNMLLDADWERRAHVHAHEDETEEQAEEDNAKQEEDNAKAKEAAAKASAKDAKAPGHMHKDGHFHFDVVPKTGDELEQEEATIEFEQELKEAVVRKRKGLFKHVLRSKGYVWLATRPDIMGLWSQAGCVVRLDPEQPWHVTWGEDFWPDDPAERAAIKAHIESHEHGDRRQEVVLIGIDLDQKALTDALNACLVTDDEWKDLARLVVDDPIPMWQMEPFDDWDKYIEKKEE